MDVLESTSIAWVEGQLQALKNTAEHFGWSFRWVPEKLYLEFERESGGTRRRLRAIVRDCPVKPPAWEFLDASGVRLSGSEQIPGAPLPNGKASIFHGSGVICAHFNRLAYEPGGPHAKKWVIEEWKRVPRAGQVVALTLGEMLAAITAHLHAAESDAERRRSG